MSQASHSTSYLLSSLPVRLLQMLTNHRAHQEFSCSPERYSYDVENHIVFLFLSSTNCSIYHVQVPTQNLFLLTSSLRSKAFFENYHCLFHKTSASHSNHFKSLSESSIHFVLTTTINWSSYDNNNRPSTHIYSPKP